MYIYDGLNVLFTAPSFLVDITHLNLDEGCERVIKNKINKQRTAKAHAKVRTSITKIKQYRYNYPIQIASVCLNNQISLN